ncbi:2-oxoglutarate and iron-dependent oxygenase domain-containing protein 3 [Armadillidium vulgare]|nr:2-oxoglutarate and iron-dependent oxygenase domain-containing protein 3 [Armadillidium vulgare]
MQSKSKLRKRVEVQDDGQNKSNKKKKNESKETEKKKETTETNGFNIDYKRIIIRCIVIVTIITIINYTQGNKLETFASVKDELKLKDLHFDCSLDFTRQLKNFKGCIPKMCGRFVADTLISLHEAQALAVIVQKGLSIAGPRGTEAEYSTMDIHSGALTKGNAFINIYEMDKSHKVITSEDVKIYRYIVDKIKNNVAEHFNINAASIYLSQPSYFVIISPANPNSYYSYWSPKADKVQYSSSDYTTHLYLTDFNYHFKGGRLVYVDKSSNKTVEPKVGRLVASTSGSENINFVEHVTSGTRIEALISFTCDPKKARKDVKFD